MDGLMMDWLYDELDPVRRQEITEHLAGCARCTAEVAGFQKARAAYQELAPVEPPAAVSAILLHEAARRAPARAGGGVGGWLAALFRPVVGHPALAAAASLVLVAGVAGTLYIKKGDMTARPAAPSETIAFAPEPTAAAREPVAPTTTPADEAAAGGDVAAAAQALAQAAPTPDPKPDPTTIEAGRGRGASGGERAFAEKKADGYAADLLDDARDQKLRKVAREESDAPAKRKLALKDRPRSTDPLIATDALEAADEGGAPSEQVAMAQPPPAPKGKPTTTASSGALGGTAGGGAAPGGVRGAPRTDKAAEARRSDDSQGSWLLAQEARALAASQQKRCREAAAIANDVLDRDPGFYGKRLAKSKDLARCSAAISDERSRRAALHNKATPSKAATQAEPAEAEADAEATAAEPAAKQ